MRIALDGAPNNLETAVTAFRNAQNATKIAAEQGKRTCLNSIGSGVLASAGSTRIAGAVALARVATTRITR